MHQSGEDKPVWVTIVANTFGGLQEMLKLIEFDIWIGIIHQRIQVIQRFKNRQATRLQREVLGPLSFDKVDRLMTVIHSIKISNPLSNLCIIISVAALGLMWLGVNMVRDEFFPVMHVLPCSFRGKVRIFGVVWSHHSTSFHGSVAAPHFNTARLRSDSTETW